jgi:hypothetical protein
VWSRQKTDFHVSPGGFLATLAFVYGEMFQRDKAKYFLQAERTEKLRTFRKEDVGQR